MENLLNEYGFDTVGEYYDMVNTSYINGQKKQAKAQFLAMPADNKKDFMRDLKTQEFGEVGGEHFEFFIDTLVDNL